MKEDQFEPEYRREIVVVPSIPDSEYYILKVGSAVQAINAIPSHSIYGHLTTAGRRPSTIEQHDKSTKRDEDTTKMTFCRQDAMMKAFPLERFE